jgi:hypothetical protein
MTTVQDAPPDVPLALSDRAARQLANATKTPAQMATITPRWLVHLRRPAPSRTAVDGGLVPDPAIPRWARPAGSS